MVVKVLSFSFKMARYSYREQTDMVFMYERAYDSGQAAARLYLDQIQIDNNLIFIQSLQFYESFLRLELGTLKQKTEEDQCKQEVSLEKNTLKCVEEDSHVSTRQVGVMLHGGHPTVWRLLHEQLYPYHIQRVQVLTPEDYPARVNFCRRVNSWMPIPCSLLQSCILM